MAILSAENVTMRFGGLVAVDSVHFEIDQGEIVGIIGPNGAGKTTFFNMLTGIYEPSEGKVVYQGKCLNKLRPFQIAELGVTRTFQNIRLFSQMTVLENVMLGCHCRTKESLLDAVFKSKRYRSEERQTEEKALELLRLSGLYAFRYEYANALPYGLQRKLEIARAMATDPQIILLDEPAAGMNENETLELNAFIKKLQAMGYTIIVIEHDIRFIMTLCDRIYVLNHGALISQGLPEQVQKDPLVIEAYLGKEEN